MLFQSLQRRRQFRLHRVLDFLHLRIAVLTLLSGFGDRGVIRGEFLLIRFHFGGITRFLFLRFHPGLIEFLPQRVTSLVRFLSGGLEFFLNCV